MAFRVAFEILLTTFHFDMERWWNFTSLFYKLHLVLQCLTFTSGTSIVVGDPFLIKICLWFNEYHYVIQFPKSPVRGVNLNEEFSTVSTWATSEDHSQNWQVPVVHQKTRTTGGAEVPPTLALWVCHITSVADRCAPLVGLLAWVPNRAHPYWFLPGLDWAK